MPFWHVYQVQICHFGTSARDNGVLRSADDTRVGGPDLIVAFDGADVESAARHLVGVDGSLFAEPFYERAGGVGPAT